MRLPKYLPRSICSCRHNSGEAIEGRWSIPVSRSFGGSYTCGARTAFNARFVSSDGFDEIAWAPVSNGLYRLILDSPPPKAALESHSNSALESNDLPRIQELALLAHHPVKRAPMEEWHRLMGHISKKVLCTLPQSVDGYILTSRCLKPCHACLMSNPTASPMPAIHELASRRYYRLFLDFVTIIHLGLNGACIRIDNDPSWKPLEEEVTQQSIKVEYTVPYQPQQNGVSEREVHTVTEHARATLYGKSWCRLKYIDVLEYCRVILKKT